MNKIYFDPCTECGGEYFAKGRCRNCYYKYKYHANLTKYRETGRLRALRLRKANPEKYKLNVRKCAAKRKERIRLFIAQTKAQPCADCRQVFPQCVMEFDHVPDRCLGTKRFRVVPSTAWASEQAVKEEVAKCDIVCANCHRLRTYMRRKKLKEINDINN